MMCVTLDNRKDFHDHHTLLEKCYLKQCSVIKWEEAVKSHSTCAGCLLALG